MILRKIAFVIVLFFGQMVYAAGEDYNFRFSPVGLIVGAVNVNFDIAVSDSWTIGPELTYWNFKLDGVSGLSSSIDITAFGAGARGNWFKNGVNQTGLYVGPSVNVVTVKGDYSEPGYSSTASVTSVVASGLVGYGWFWSSFNILLGGGFSVPLSNSKIEVKDSTGTQVSESTRRGSLALEFSLGWTF